MFRMRKAPAMVLAAAVGVGSALGLGHVTAAGRRPPKLVPIVRVTGPVAQSATIGRADLIVAQVPAGGEPPGAITSLSAAVGRTAAVVLVPGQDLVRADLAATTLRDGLEPGQVAFTIPLQSPADGAGLEPGSVVTVIAAPKFEVQGVAGAPTTLCTARVIAVYTSAGTIASTQPPAGGLAAAAQGATGTGPAAVRLAVSLAEAESLAGALGRNTLYVAPSPWSPAP